MVHLEGERKVSVLVGFSQEAFGQEIISCHWNTTFKILIERILTLGCSWQAPGLASSVWEEKVGWRGSATFRYIRLAWHGGSLSIS